MIKSIQIILTICCLAVLLIACSSKKVSQKKLNIVTVVQNGTHTTLKKVNNTITLDADAFSLRFYSKRYDSENSNYYATRIAAFLTTEEFDQINNDMIFSEHPNFSSGTGMAGGRQRYESLIFKDEAHHYTYYNNEEDRRLNLIEQSNENLLLEFNVTQFMIDRKIIPLSDTNIKQFYLAIINDRNRNYRIDDGELTKIAVRFK